MQLKDLYKKDITREIQGVIKVDDEHSIAQELDEYIVTDEIAKQWAIDKKFEPRVTASEAEQRIVQWKRAVERSRQWVEPERW